MGNWKQGLVRTVARRAMAAASALAGGRLTEERFWIGGGWAGDQRRRAMQATAVYGCVKILSESIGGLPLHLMERLGTGQRQKKRAVDHPLYRILHDEPNPDMDAMLYGVIGQMHQELRGVTYSVIERTRSGQVAALWPVNPDRVTPKIESRKLAGWDLDDGEGGVAHLAPWELLRIIGLSEDGLTPISPIKACAQAIDLSLEGEDFTTRFFKNDARPRGVIEVDGPLAGKDADQAKAIKAEMKREWHELYGGENKNGIAVLDNSMKFKPVSINPEDADVLAQRKFSVAEIAGRIFQVPLFMIGESEKNTSWGSGIEQQMVGFVTYTLRNRLVRNERAMGRALLTPAERAARDYYIEYTVEELLRGDKKSQNEALAIQRQNGIISGNDWRDIVGMSPLPAEIGDVYMVNGNMMAVGAKGNKSNDGDPAT